MQTSASESESDLYLLTTCDEMEALAVRALLDADDIPCVIQGEHNKGMLGPALGGGVIELRVLVAWKNLERARALLSSHAESPEERATSLAAGVQEDAAPPCPVHGEVSTAVCTGCDTFLCARCDAPGSPPLCRDCREHKSAVPSQRWNHRRRVAGWMALFLIFGPGLLGGLYSLLWGE